MLILLLLISNLNFLSFILFIIGICGIIFNYKNIILTLLSIELCLLAINLNFIFISIFINDIIGIIFSLIILTVAAAEAAIGLAILVLFYRVRSSIVINYTNYLRG
jgi:NADH-quinone oxidoreductase subunit K